MKRVYHLALTILVASFTILGLLSYIYSDRISAFFAAKEVLTERQNKLPRFHIPLSKWRPKASPTASDIHFDCEDQFRFTLLGDNCTKYKDESQHVQAWSCPDSPAHKGILVSFIPTCRYPFSPKGNVAGAKCLIRIQKLLSWSENDLSLLMTEKEIRYFLADGALRGLSLPQNVEAPEAIVRKNRLDVLGDSSYHIYTDTGWIIEGITADGISPEEVVERISASCPPLARSFWDSRFTE